MDDHVANINRLPISYWANTSSNSIVKDLIERADDMAKSEIEKLIAGGTIEKPVHEDITCFDAKTFENEIGKLLRQSISFNDYYENFYHGFLVGILTGLEGCSLV